MYREILWVKVKALHPFISYCNLGRKATEAVHLISSSLPMQGDTAGDFPCHCHERLHLPISLILPRLANYSSYREDVGKSAEMGNLEADKEHTPSSCSGFPWKQESIAGYGTSQWTPHFGEMIGEKPVLTPLLIAICLKVLLSSIQETLSGYSPGLKTEGVKKLGSSPIFLIVKSAPSYRNY